MSIQGNKTRDEVLTMDVPHYLVLLVFILFIVYQFTSKRRNQYRKPPPSPPSVPIIGHFKLLLMPIDYAVKILADKYGSIYLLRLGSRPILVLSCRAAIEECFLNNDIIFSNRPFLRSRKDFEYNYKTLGGPYGNHWRNLRRFSATEIFSERRLQISSEIRTEEIIFMIKHLYKSSLKGVRRVELKIYFYLMAFNIVMKMVAGKRCFEEEELDSATAKRKLGDFMQMFSPSVPLVLGDYFPFLRWFTYYGEERKQLKTHKRKDAFLQALLDAHQITSLSTSLNGGKTSQSIIDVMLKLQESEPEFYTNDVIKGMIQAMFMAGTHTTSFTMGWVVTYLMSHPDVFQKAREEIDNKVGNRRLINDTDLAKLPYLQCIINETLRLKVDGVLPARESSKECTVGGYHIPRGTQLYVNARAVHRDPELWTEPNSFKPERFLGSEEEKGKIKFIAFGLGRRACPGEGLAMRVMALFLGTLIQCFDWEDARNDSQGPKRKSPVIVFRPREALSKLLAQL